MPDRKSVGRSLHDKRADASLDLRVDEKEPCIRCIGDVGLAPVEDIFVPGPSRGCLHPEDIGTGTRLGHSHGTDHLAREGGGEKARTLVGVSGLMQVVHKKQSVRQIGQAEPRVTPRDLMVGDDRGGGIEPGATVGFGHGQAEKPQFSGPAHQWPVEFAALVESGRLGFHFVGDEFDHHFSEQTVLFTTFARRELAGKIFAG